MNYLKLTGIALSISLLTGCSYFGFSNSRVYSLDEDPAALEVPPDLSAPSDSGLLAIPQFDISSSTEPTEKRVLQEPKHVALLRNGSNYWIRVEGDRENIWANLLQFWDTTQIKLRVKSKEHGIIETTWFGGDDKRFVSKTRDKFRLRIEQAGDGRNSAKKSLEIYITHYGAITTDTGAEKPTWESRPRDRDLELEFLHQLADYLDREQVKVSVGKKQASSYSIHEENLTISEDFRSAWRKVGIAMEQANILIDDRDRNKGIYFVTEVDFLDDLDSKRGPLDRWVFGEKVAKGKPFEVHIKSKGEQSVISIVGETMSSTKKVFVLRAIRDNL